MQLFVLFVSDGKLLEIIRKRSSGGCSGEFMMLLLWPFLNAVHQNLFPILHFPYLYPNRSSVIEMYSDSS